MATQQVNWSIETFEKFVADGNIAAFKAEIDKLANPNDPVDKSLWTPLLYATWTGCLPMVKYLVEEKKIDIDYFNKNFGTALNIAANTSLDNIVEYLLSKGAKTTHTLKTPHNDTALHYALYSKAAKEKKFECFRLLVEAGADIEAETKLGARPIMLAVQGGDLEIVKLLIARKATVNFADVNGSTPFINALYNGHDEIALLLLENGAKVDKIVGRTGDSCLSLACSGGSLKMIKLLIEKGLDIRHKNDRGETPLYSAIYAKKLDVVKYFIEELKENIDQVSYNNETPLWVACYAGALEIVKYLMEKDANPTIMDSTETLPWGVAAGRSHLEVIQYLIPKLEEHPTLKNDKAILYLHPEMNASGQNRNAILKFLQERQQK